MTDPYLKIPMILFKLDVTTIERYILALTISYGGTMRASNNRLAEMFCVERRSIINAVNKLRDRGYIDRDLGVNGRVISLASGEIIALLKQDGSSEKITPASENNSPLSSEKSYQSSEKTSPNSKYRKPSDSNIKEKRGRFTPPTPEQVTDYAKSIGFDLDGGYWVDKYTANGWMVGKNKMKDWQATVRTWKKNEKEYGQRKTFGTGKRGTEGTAIAGFAEQVSSRTDIEIIDMS